MTWPNVDGMMWFGNGLGFNLCSNDVNVKVWDYISTGKICAKEGLRGDDWFKKESRNCEPGLQRSTAGNEVPRTLRVRSSIYFIS